MPAARRLAVVTSLVALVVVGCSEEPEPRFAEPSASASGSDPSQSASPSGSSAEERELLESFFAAVSAAISSGDSSQWLAMTATDCANCATLATNLEMAYANGGSIRGGGWTLVDAEFLRSDDDGRVWSATVQSKRERWINADGDLVKTVRPDVLYFEVALRIVGGELTVGGIRAGST